jgi:hypothetical protein
MARSRTMTGAGVVATAALVLIFGNQAMTDWVNNHTRSNSAWGWYLRVLTWPSWLVGTSSSAGWQRVLALDLRALLLILFVALILSLVSKSVSGGAGGFLLGWSALIFASALAAFLTAFIVSHPTLLGALEDAALGSRYGLFVGWIVGILTAGGKAE